MGTLATMVHTLHETLLELEGCASCEGDWLRLHAAVMRAALTARNDLAGTCPTLAQLDEVVELLEELRYIKLCAEANLLELSASADQRSRVTRDHRGL